MATRTLPLALAAFACMGAATWLLVASSGLPEDEGSVGAGPNHPMDPGPGALVARRPQADAAPATNPTAREALPSAQAPASANEPDEASPGAPWLLRVRIASGYPAESTFRLSEPGTFGQPAAAFIARGVAEFPNLPAGSRWELEVVTSGGEEARERVVIPTDLPTGTLKRIHEVSVSPKASSVPTAWLVDGSGFPIAFTDVTASAQGRRVAFTTDELGAVRFDSVEFLRAVEEIRWTALVDNVELVGEQATVIPQDQSAPASGGLLGSAIGAVRLGRVVLRPRQ